MHERRKGVSAPGCPEVERRYKVSPTLVASLAMLLCYPLAEAGVVDDWSYIWTARDFATSGNIHYNGWATAILGWQIYMGAIFIKLFGSSFTAIRLSVALTSLVFLVVVGEFYILAGLSKDNSRFCTMAVVASASFLQSATAFMSDIPGMLAIYVCLYCCLRAHRSESSASASWWVILAIVSNTLLGTARQIAWLGTLTVVPFFIWQQRARLRGRLLQVLLVFAAAGMFIVGTTAWFGRQPYALHEALFFLHRNQISQFGWLTLAMISLVTPVTVCFIARLSRLCQVCTVLTSAAFTTLSLNFPKWLATFTELIAPVARGSAWIAGILLFCANTGVMSLCLYGAERCRRKAAREDVKVDMWLLKLLLPFGVAYNVLLVTRATLFVRYALPLIPLLILGLGLVYQGSRHRSIPKACYIMVGFMLMLAVIDNHDAYARLRALKKAEILFVEGGGIRNQLRAGFALDMWREIEVAGFVNDPRIVRPAGAYRQVDLSGIPCGEAFDSWTPHIKPRFSLSDKYGPCNLPVGRTPVPYTTWWPPHKRSIVLGSLP